MDISSQETQNFFLETAVSWGTSLLLALLILLVGFFVAQWIVRLATGAMGRTRLDPMLVGFARNILRSLLLLIVIMAALDKVGVDTTSFIALLGAAGIAVGLALKDSLQNFASGVMLIFFRPFRAGDFIEAAGTAGIVEEIRLFHTRLRTPDNREMIIPNGDLYSGAITNNSARETRRIDLVVGIGYDDDLRQAKKILEGIVMGHERILPEPEPLVAVGELGDSSVDLYVRPWVKTVDFFSVKCELTEQIKLALDDAGISIPYPQMDVHLPSAGD